LLNVDIKQYIIYFKFISKSHIFIFSKASFIKIIFSGVFTCFNAKGVLKDISSIFQLLKVSADNNHIVNHHLTFISFRDFINNFLSKILDSPFMLFSFTSTFSLLFPGKIFEISPILISSLFSICFFLFSVLFFVVLFTVLLICSLFIDFVII
jgi:hypothetical protein